MDFQEYLLIRMRMKRKKRIGLEREERRREGGKDPNPDLGQDPDQAQDPVLGIPPLSLRQPSLLRNFS